MGARGGLHASQVVFTALTSRLFRLGLTPHCLLCIDAAVSGLGGTPLSPDSTVAPGTSSRTRGGSGDDIMAAAVGWVPGAEKEGSHVDMRTGHVDILMEAGGFELDGEGTVASQPERHPSPPPNLATT